jgi:hypothetical protein
MLPDFDEHGNLPVGIHRATLAEVIARYSKPSMRRRALTREMRDFASLIEPAAHDIYLVGSYITKKLFPRDVDFLVIFRFNWKQQFPNISQHVEGLYASRLVRDRTAIHCLYCESHDRQCQHIWIQWFSHARPGEGGWEKGMIRLEVDND